MPHSLVFAINILCDFAYILGMFYRICIDESDLSDLASGYDLYSEIEFYVDKNSVDDTSIFQNIEFEKLIATDIRVHILIKDLIPSACYLLTHLIPKIPHLLIIEYHVPPAYELYALSNLQCIRTLRCVSWYGGLRTSDLTNLQLDKLILDSTDVSSVSRLNHVRDLALIDPLELDSFIGRLKDMENFPKLQNLSVISNEEYTQTRTIMDIVQYGPRTTNIKCHPVSWWGAADVERRNSRLLELSLTYTPKRDMDTHLYSVIFEDQQLLIHKTCPNLKLLSIKNIILHKDTIEEFSDIIRVVK
jgi:hypothetical protein